MSKCSYETSHCTFSPCPRTLDDYKGLVTFTAKADNCYVFSLPPRMFYTIKGESNEKSYPFTLDASKRNATLEVNVDYIDPSCVVDFFGKAIQGEISGTSTFKYTLENCTKIEGPDTSLDIGKEFTITLEADDGFQFEKSHPPKVFVGAGVKDGFSSTDYLHLSDDRKRATYHVSSSTRYKYEITAKAAAIPVSNSLNYINAYNLTKDELRQLSEKPFPQWDGSSGKQIDYRSFILRLMYLPCKPTTSTTETEIKAGYFDTGVNAKQIVNDTVHLDLGTLTVMEKYGNAIDYMGRVSIYLPYMGIYDIPVVDVMGRTIRLMYHINVVNGVCLTTLTDTDAKIVVFQRSENVSENISFSMNEMTLTLQKDSKPDATSYMENTPYLILHHKIPDATPNTVLSHKREMARIVNLIGKGFISGEILDGDLEDDTITNTEVAEIKSLFMEGVIV